MNQKQSYIEIFIAVIGITPQVLTESLFYYYSPYYKQNRSFDRVIVFTTLEGKKELINALFDLGKLEELERKLKLPKNTIPFTKNDIKIFCDDNNNPLSDIRTTEDNNNSFNILHDEFKRWTKDRKTRITATVAGGRKTMSAQMALTFQLFGRKRDELFHIIVPNNELTERKKNNDNTINYHKTWFYPNNPKDPSEKLDVSILPVLRVGRYFSKDLNLPAGELYTRLQEEIIEKGPIEELIIKGNKLISENEILTLPPYEMSLFNCFINKRINSTCDSICRGCENCYIRHGELGALFFTLMRDEHKKLYNSNSGHFEKSEINRANLKKRINSSYRAEKELAEKEVYDKIDQINSKLKSKIKKSNISNRFKKGIMIKSEEFEEDSKMKWIGVSIDPLIVKYENLK